jgi:serine/threonine-protein kinase
VPHAAVLSGRALDGRYELHAVIGEGTFGRVYRGHDRRLARPVAVKLIKPWWTEDPEWAQSFEREAQLMARVSDPGIVQIFDIGHADEGLYYVAELVDGESLADRLQRGPLEPAAALAIAAQLCRALAKAHAQRVVHRDIKPANVLISSEGRVKVGDFGIARLAEGSTDAAAGTVVGTPRYMAPEQARGRPTTPATDVYSAGIVLYEMLAGRPPFAERSAVELALRHVSDPPPPLPDGTPRSLVEIVDRALAKDPAARYQSGREMADALDAAQTAPARSRVGPNSTLVAPRRNPRRNVNPTESRRYRALLAVVLLVVVGIVAAAVLTAGDGVRVPSLDGLSSAAASSKLKAVGLRAGFSRSYDSAPPGTVIAQRPGPGAHVGDGTRLGVTLSRGPRPVTVPALVGEVSGTAQATLRHLGLTAAVTQVPAPGGTPGLVVGQSPGSEARLPPHSTVALSVAETPRWRPLTSFAGSGGGSSVPFTIRGTRWQVVYKMAYDGSCTLLLFCSGPSAQVSELNSGANVTQFDLGEGTGQTRVVGSGPGTYQIRVTPGSDTARWSIAVDDYY